MIRELISKISISLSERLASARCRYTAPIRIWFDPEQNTDRSRHAAWTACLNGETVDISSTGFSFLVPSIRVNEKYLVGQERNLNIEMDLPTGKIRLTAIGRRYEKVGMHSSTEKFFVGAEIVNMSGADKENYDFFLRTGTLHAKTPASLELGID